MKLLLIGNQGQLGQGLALELKNVGTVIGLDYPEIDLSDAASIRSFMDEHKPQIVINAAAYTAVDLAEKEIEKAEAINDLAVGMLAEACKEIDAFLVHYSTDYVFDGTADQPYRETDQTNPLGVYGRTKRSGEVRIESTLDKYLILRSSWIYSFRCKNFLKTMVNLIQEKDELSIVNDQIGSPTSADFLARMTAHAIDQLIKNNFNSTGLYHLTCASATSWYEFARQIKTNLGLDGAKLHPVSTDSYPTPAPRPAYSVLDSSKFADEFSVDIPDWDSELKKCCAEQKLKDF